MAVIRESLRADRGDRTNSKKGGPKAALFTKSG
jgi:hypothetical protein